MAYSALGLILRKNYTLKYRRCGCIIEVIVPILFFLIAAGVRQALKNEVHPAQTFSAQSVISPNLEYIISTAENLAPSGNVYVAYGPSNPYTDNVMALFKAELLTQLPGSYASKALIKPYTDVNEMISDAVYPTVSGIMAAVTFTNLHANGSIPLSMSYSLSMCASCTENTEKLTPNTVGGANGPNNFNNYVSFGFLSFQALMDHAIGTYLNSGISPFESVVTNFHQFPYPEYVENRFGRSIGFFLSLFIVLSWIYTASMVVKDIVLEKERRLREAMRMMGLAPWIGWLGWGITSVSFIFISVIFMTIICKVAKVLEYSEAGLIFVFFLLAGLSTVSYCFLVSTFFTRANVASAASGVLFFICYIPYMFVSNPETYEGLSRSAKMGLSILSPSAIGVCGKSISQWEERGIGATWANIREGSSGTDSFSIADSFGMLCIDIIVYLVLTWYIDAVYPGRYGVPKPWHFFLHSAYWTGKHEVQKVTENHQAVGTGLEDSALKNIEAAPEGLQAGIEIRNLFKVFDDGKKVALDGLSLNMYQGQITSLLGHNGAGKTTLMSILTGLYAPTTGDALVGGYSVATDIEGVRQSLGLCPQFDVLFDSLTVEEHLRFFCRLKGLEEPQVEAEVNSMIQDLNLVDKRKAAASTLSGGMKRRLSVAIAFVGGSKIVMLDEPTAGMDPYARRATWELILKHKVGRTIILTTHFMDEADLLGDRIAIMAFGRLQCVGSSLFLKSRYGVGYHMVVAKQPGCETERIAAAVSAFVPEAKIENDVGTELSFILPRESSSKFPVLFDSLDSQKEALKISTYGVSVTTMEEVFLRVGHDADKNEKGSGHGQDDDDGHHGKKNKKKKAGGSEATLLSTSTTNGANAGANASASANSITNGDGGDSSISHEKSTINFSAAGADTTYTGPRITGQALRLQHLKGMILKRVNHSRRDKKSIISQLLVPVFFVIFALAIAKAIPPAGTKDPRPLTFADTTPSKYAQYNFYFNSSDPSSPSNAGFIAPLAASVAARGDTFVTTSNMTASLLGSYNELRNRFVSVAAASFEADSPSTGDFTADLWYVPDMWHIRPTLLNAFDSAVIAKAVPGASISATNAPLPPTAAEKDLDTRKNGAEFTVAILLVFGMSFLAGSFVSILVQERITGAKHLQLLAGADLFSYWLGSFVWDYINYCIPMLFIWLVFGIFNLPQYVGSNFGAIAMLFLFYGWSAIPFVYCLSFLFRSTTTAYVVLILLNIILGLGCIIVVWILEILETALEANDALKWVFLVFPIYALGRGTMDVAYNDLLSLARGGTQVERNPLDWDVAGKNVVFMFFMGIVFFLFLLAIEYRVFSFDNFRARRQRAKLLAKRAERAKGTTDTSTTTNHGNVYIEMNGNADEDIDVAAERKRVYEAEAAVKNGAVSAETLDVIRIIDLSKVYPGSHGKDKIAVDALTVGIPKNECFGLLGVNGAGKTTSFKMLTGELGTTSGDAFLAGHSILSDILEARRRIGYCPQFDGILDNLTGREVLFLYARLRGLPESEIPRIAESWIRKLELDIHADRPCGNYSGGNKRKLSTAVAFIGDPPIIFLDEPTTGMDPKARRFLWNVISSIMSDGRSIVLTSHSMEECEALCTRLGIMVNGKFMCMGSPQHLKSRFGTGYDLMIKISPTADTTPVKNLVATAFPTASFKEEHNGMVRYEVSSEGGLSLSKVFGTMESNKEVLKIEDYSLSQTSLEQIFLSFASKQHGGDLI